MTDKEPMLLIVLIETSRWCWYVAGISLVGEPLPLLRSETGNLSPYLGIPFDEQVSFLRHRLSGVLQRGCDRLWGRQKKPCQIVFVADGPFVQADAELTARVAEHFVEWMTRPPVVFFIAARGFASPEPPVLEQVAGDLDSALRRALDAGLPALRDALARPDAWEPVPTKGNAG
jgi:hypothetical protein